MTTNLAPYEALQIVKEISFGTQKVTPVAGVDSIYIRLAGANRFTMRPIPTDRDIPFGGGFDVPGYTVSDQVLVTGNLSLELCYSQASMLLNWCATRINGAQTLPWPTTEPIGDLDSCTVSHLIARSDDGTYKRTRYKGVKVGNWKLAASAQSGLVMLDMGLQAQKWDGNAIEATADPDATAFPVPPDTAFPTDPLLFYQSTTTAAGSALTYVQGITIDVNNAMDARFFTGATAGRFIGLNRIRGRKSTASLDLIYTATPNWRPKLEAITSEALSFAFSNSVNTVTVDFKANNLIKSLSDALAPGKLYDQTVSYTNQYDTASSLDLAFTFA